MLLAIDTATSLLSIALHNGEALLAECTLTVDRNHSGVLAPLVQQTLAQCRVRPDDISALAACIGPGSYTGLRVGVALAKGMAAARDLPLVPATTLDIIACAQDHAMHEDRLIVTVPAGRNRVIWAEYRYLTGGWSAASAAQLGDWDDLLGNSKAGCALTGEINSAGLERVSREIESGRSLRLISPARRLRRAGYLAEIAWERLGRDGAAAFPADQVKPVYLKSPG